jgi:hypothetical protein
MADVADRLLDSLAGLESVADDVTPDEAAAQFDDATLQVFWRDWPRMASWAGALWRQLDADMALPSSSVSEPDVDEVGGEGG